MAGIPSGANVLGNPVQKTFEQGDIRRRETGEHLFTDLVNDDPQLDERPAGLVRGDNAPHTPVAIFLPAR
jgi:hypothetical protein